MLLVVKIELDKNKENYQAVMEALEAFDIASASWEDESKEPSYKISVSGKTDPNELASNLSAAVDRHRGNLGK